jgi:hypothetical protein
MSISMIVLLSDNFHDFDEKTCSLNRIELSAEAGLGIFIFVKDLAVLCCSAQ